jgi:hypothetical protein
MTLRHIDPGTIDWMDAMLEGEPVKKVVKEATKSAAPGEMAADPQAAAPPGPDADQKP